MRAAFLSGLCVVVAVATNAAEPALPLPAEIRQAVSGTGLTVAGWRWTVADTTVEIDLTGNDLAAVAESIARLKAGPCKGAELARNRPEGSAFTATVACTLRASRSEPRVTPSPPARPLSTFDDYFRRAATEPASGPPDRTVTDAFHACACKDGATANFKWVVRISPSGAVIDMLSDLPDSPFLGCLKVRVAMQRYDASGAGERLRGGAITGVIGSFRTGCQ